MASEASVPAAACGGNIEVFPWLKTLPVAPEYHPTLAEFQDPIAYIFKIEKEASSYGICKIVPPVPAPPKKTSLANLNKSLSARSGSGPTFTSRQQQIGFCPRKHRPVQKPVWQSGENYTLPEFETKAKAFEKNYLRKSYKKNLTPLEIETLYWKATVDKPFSVEYANDMPGSAFAPIKCGKDGGKQGNANNNITVGETEWNMRGVSRAKGSLLRFMKEEIPGVTSPMVYIAMMFSWFAWHVEDHDLHSLNYLHMGAGKTWYGVPKDAAVAFEEVIRVHGYGGEINPLVTFATLGEKTTVMSPEVLIDAGVPCCRLVQNPGEFVVTFPRAYHSGFSLGFNCGEAANIATPEWLRVAKDAAVRRASINCPPMVSHFQLLYDLALSFSSRVPKSIPLEPRSSRLKDKKKGEGGELLVKDLFVQDVMQNNDLLHILADGSSVVVLPRNSLGTCSNLKAGSEFQARLSSGLLCSPDLAMKKNGVQPGPGAYSKETLASSCVDKRLFHSERGADALGLSSQFKNVEIEGERTSRGDRLSEQGLFSCVTCGILCFASVAIVQPTNAASHYLITADCSTFKDWEESSDASTDAFVSGEENLTESSRGQMNKRKPDGLFDVPVQSAEQIELSDDENAEMISNGDTQKNTSSLGLLALAYGNSSDSEEDEAEADVHIDSCKTKYMADLPQSVLDDDNAGSTDQEADSYHDISNSEIDFLNALPLQFIRPRVEQELTRSKSESRYKPSLDWPVEHKANSFTSTESDNLIYRSRHQMKLQHGTSSCIPVTHVAETTMTSGLLPLDDTTPPFSPRSDEDSSRKHVFCLQHAIQVEKKLRSIGGAHILLLCHPDYPKVEAHAKKLAEELGNDHIWSDISFREASGEDEGTMRLALESEEAIHGNGDWAVKLGINLYYSANLSRSPLYSKQMPYNFIIYNAFGRSCPTSPTKAEFDGNGKLKKTVVAGKWCGKVWMSNQVHQLLAERDHGEEERRTAYRVQADVKPERPAEINSVETASRICKPGRKRKGTAEIRPGTKAKSAKVDQDEAFEDLSMDCSLQQCKSKLRNKRMKKEKPEPRIKGARNKRELNIETEDEGKPRNKCVKNKKELNKEIEDEPVAQKCVKNKKQLNVENEDEPKSCSKRVRSKRELYLEDKDHPRSRAKCVRNKRQVSLDIKNEPEGGPSTRLRKRPEPSKDRGARSVEVKATPKKQQHSVQQNSTKAKKGLAGSKNAKARGEKADFPCDLEGCTMSFGSKQELLLHKRNICPVKDCGKKFFSHKYLVQHRRVHVDERPLKCPWKGCKMTFKWAWARTEHIRVHTGARPYVCSEAGCGQTFRFVSDFSRHKRKTGHSSKKGR